MVEMRGNTTNQVPDDELVVLSLLGSLAAFDELVRRYRGAVVRVTSQILGCRTSAEDAAQDALVIAFKALPQLQDPGRFPAWLCSIARHRALRVANQEMRTVAADKTDLDRLIIERCPELTINPAELVIGRFGSSVLRAMEALPEEVRLVMELRYCEEWSITAIASFLSLPLTTVKWRLHTGRKTLRRILSSDETFHIPAKVGDMAELAGAVTR